MAIDRQQALAMLEKARNDPRFYKLHPSVQSAFDNALTKNGIQLPDEISTAAPLKSALETFAPKNVFPMATGAFNYAKSPNKEGFGGAVKRAGASALLPGAAALDAFSLPSRAIVPTVEAVKAASTPYSPFTPAQAFKKSFSGQEFVSSRLMDSEANRLAQEQVSSGKVNSGAMTAQLAGLGMATDVVEGLGWGAAVQGVNEIKQGARAIEEAKRLSAYKSLVKPVPIAPAAPAPVVPNENIPLHPAGDRGEAARASLGRPGVQFDDPLAYQAKLKEMSAAPGQPSLAAPQKVDQLKQLAIARQRQKLAKAGLQPLAKEPSLNEKPLIVAPKKENPLVGKDLDNAALGLGGPGTTSKTPQWLKESYAESDLRTKGTPFVEADLQNESVRKAIAGDPYLSAAQKEKLLGKAKNPLQQGVEAPKQTFNPEQVLADLEKVKSKPAAPVAENPLIPSPKQMKADSEAAKSFFTGKEPAAPGLPQAAPASPKPPRVRLSKLIGKKAVIIAEGRNKGFTAFVRDADKETVTLTGGGLGKEELKLPRKDVQIGKRQTPEPVENILQSAKSPEVLPEEAPFQPAKPKKISNVLEASGGKPKKMKNLLQEADDEAAHVNPVMEEKIKAGVKNDVEKINKEIDDLAAQAIDARLEDKPIEDIIALQAKITKLKVRRAEITGKVKDAPIPAEERVAKPKKKIFGDEAGQVFIGNSKSAEDDLPAAYKQLKPLAEKDGQDIYEVLKKLKTEDGKPMFRASAVDALKKGTIPGDEVMGVKGEKVGNVNIKTMPSNVQAFFKHVAEDKPEVFQKNKYISNEETRAMARQLRDGDSPVIDMMRDNPELFAANVYKEYSKIGTFIKESLEQDLSGVKGLKGTVDKTIQNYIEDIKAVKGSIGRAQQLANVPIEVQQDIVNIIRQWKAKYAKDPVYGKDKAFLGKFDDLLAYLKDKGILDNESLPNFWDKAHYIWINSILSHPMTRLANGVSNLTFALQKIPDTAFASLFSREVSLKEIPGQIKGIGEFAKNKALGRKSVVPIPSGNKTEVLQSPIALPKNKILKAINDNIIPTEYLRVDDNVAKELVGLMEYYGRSAGGLGGKALKEAVTEEQLYRTFQADVGRFTKSLINMRQETPALRWIIPFIKTPANILKEGVKRTPFGFINVARKGLSKSYGSGRDVAMDLSKATQGSIGAAMIAWLYGQGKITPSLPDDPSARDALSSGRQNRPPDSIKIGNKWVSISRLEPFATSFTVIANLIRDYEASDKEIPAEKVMEAVSGVAKTLTRKTYLSGFTNLVLTLAGYSSSPAQLPEKIISGFVPGVSKFATDLKDPFYRRAETLLDKMRARSPLPGNLGSKSLPYDLDVFGQPKKKPGLLDVREATTSQLEEALKETPISVAARGKYTPQQYNRIVLNSGPDMKRVLQRMVSSNNWNNIPVGIRQTIVDSTVSAYRRRATAPLLWEEINKDPRGYIKKKYLDSRK